MAVKKRGNVVLWIIIAILVLVVVYLLVDKVITGNVIYKNAPRGITRVSCSQSKTCADEATSIDVIAYCIMSVPSCPSSAICSVEAQCPAGYDRLLSNGALQCRCDSTRFPTYS